MMRLLHGHTYLSTRAHVIEVSILGSPDSALSLDASLARDACHTAARQCQFMLFRRGRAALLSPVMVLIFCSRYWFITILISQARLWRKRHDDTHSILQNVSGYAIPHQLHYYSHILCQGGQRESHAKFLASKSLLISPRNDASFTRHSGCNFIYRHTFSASSMIDFIQAAFLFIASLYRISMPLPDYRFDYIWSFIICFLAYFT